MSKYFPRCGEEGDPLAPVAYPGEPMSTVPDLAKSDALLSPCGVYRYWLKRVWHDAYPIIAWIMLNPSTADATKDDPTIRRCIGFSKSWGAGGLVVVNLFAWRATDPKDLPRGMHDAIGPDNDRHILEQSAGRRVVCAWGSHGGMWQRGFLVRHMLAAAKCEMVCLKRTASGEPGHPLYVRSATVPIPFNALEAA